jgi:hypothetical protein
VIKVWRGLTSDVCERVDLWRSETTCHTALFLVPTYPLDHTKLQ